MTRGQAFFVHIANVAVCGTGLVYAWMRYLLEPADEWSVVNHPWQPHLQHLHVLVAPLLVFAGGLIWRQHILERIRGNGSGGRGTGMALTVQFMPMVFSGYLIQVSVTESWRLVWIWTHLVTGGLWCLAVISHRFRASTEKDHRAKHP